MLLTKYITPEDFNDYFGIDLRAELNDGSNVSNKAEMFLRNRVENRIEAYINSNFNRNIELEYPQFTDYQKQHYKQALLEQALYIFINGDISVDSGADEDGIKISRGRIEELSISPNCKNELRLCGIWNRSLPHGNGWF